MAVETTPDTNPETSPEAGPTPPADAKPRFRRLKRGLLIVGSILVVCALVFGGGALWLYVKTDIDTVGKVAFTNELAVPPLAPSRIDEQGRRVFNLRMLAGSTEFRPGRQTQTWGFNGSYLGPTLRAARGEQVVVNVENTLPEASSVHWHGMHLPAAMDGGPHQMVDSGAKWSPTWRIDQPASTLWYHPHPHGTTERHVQRGLAGMFILDDPQAAALALPKDYGDDDIPVIVQDVRFDGDSFDHGRGLFASSSGFLGDRILVNGTLGAYKTVDDELVRLRLLNASTARIYDFGFDDKRAFSLVATDGGLVERPAAMDRIRLSPGERAEIVVRMKPGEKTVLRTFPLDIGLGLWDQRMNGGDDTFDVLQLRAAEKLRPSAALPGELTRLQLPTGQVPAQTRRFELLGVEINGKGMDMNRIDQTVVRGTEEVWEVRNADGAAHSFHVHDTQFKVLDVNGKTPPVPLRGAKDTVLITPGSTVRIALRFDGPADPDTPYMYHCHLLYHEDSGMMGQFVVVNPGQQAGTPPRHEPAGPGAGAHAHP
ncbi:multicopper oxidase domain-containing protein [Embleya sp. NPDC005575]|uniref:multicopper oxidase family protein n=1 Tax=Embleya sp. NPDC005575 TaxID=3156892 RepID=UPI0033A2EDB9